jgi:hypothetical protein
MKDAYKRHMVNEELSEEEIEKAMEEREREREEREEQEREKEKAEAYYQANGYPLDERFSSRHEKEDYYNSY